MPPINLLVQYPKDATECLIGIVCANTTFIAIYGVVFTILISLGVYVYGIQDKSEKVALIDDSSIGGIIKRSLFYFVLTFLNLPIPLYQILNFALLADLIIRVFTAFSKIISFNKNELSSQRAVTRYKQKIVHGKLKFFHEIKDRNKANNEFLDQKDVDRFVFEEDFKSYDFVRSNRDGYISDVNFENLFLDKAPLQIQGAITDQSKKKNKKYFIPYEIAVGNKIQFEDIIVGIRKIEKTDGTLERDPSFNEDKIRAMISVSAELENPTDYLRAELRTYYPDMFALISASNYKGLEFKLADLSKFVNLFVTKPDAYTEIVQYLNDDIILPLQRYAFKNGDIDTIRYITSFSSQYIYKTLYDDLKESFQIFLKNIGISFYDSFAITDPKIRSQFYELFFRRLRDLCRYSIRPRLEKDEAIYKGYALSVLAVYNNLLKIAYDNNNSEVLGLVVDSLNICFERENYHHTEHKELEEVIVTKKAILFGFTAWAYKYYGSKKTDPEYLKIITILINGLSQDSTRKIFGNPDDINYYITIYREALRLADGKSEEGRSFGWDSWDMPEEHVFTVTIRDDLKILLIDRLISVFISNPTIAIDIAEGNYNEELSLLKQGSQFDILASKNPDFFFASSRLDTDSFAPIKQKVHDVFNVINTKYEDDVNINLIKQSLDEEKFIKFAQENIAAYHKLRVLKRIGTFVKKADLDKNLFGYNMLLNKEQFVKETNIHYINDDQFGENLAKSEDNRILEKITSILKSEIKQVEAKKLIDYISNASDFNTIIIWAKNHFDIKRYDIDNIFEPYWLDQSSKEENGPYYQGSIKGKRIYIVYQFDEQKEYKDMVFLFKENPFSVEEYKPDVEVWPDQSDLLVFDAEDESLSLQVKSLSNSEATRTNIINKWVTDGVILEEKKQEKEDEIKRNVVLRFLKALKVDSLEVRSNTIMIINIIGKSAFD